MLKLAFVAALTVTPAYAADVPRPAPPSLAVTFTDQEARALLESVRNAAARCGADFPDGCTIGSMEAALNAKLRPFVIPTPAPPKK